MAFEALLQEYEARRAKALAGGGEEKYAKRTAKVIVRAATREAAIDQLIAALEAFEIQGLKNNIPAVLNILRSKPFRAGRVHTGIISEVTGRKV